MRKDHLKPTPPLPHRLSTLSIRVGAWFEAHASGWGVAAVPIVVAMLLAAAGFGWLALG